MDNQQSLPVDEGDENTNPLEEPRDGYIHLFDTGFDMKNPNAFGKQGTLISNLDCLHRPYHIDRGMLVKSPIQHNQIQFCTKLHFVTLVMEKLREYNINLDIAIVCSSDIIEDLLAEALRLNNVEFLPLSQFPKAQITEFSGVLVRFRKKPNARRKFRMRVDHIIIYDPSQIKNRDHILEHFQGVYFDKPQIVSLVCVQTPDMRICHYKDDHPDITIDPEQEIALLPEEQADLFVNPIYQKHGRAPRISHNKYMMEKLMLWMALKDDTAFVFKLSKKRSQRAKGLLANTTGPYMPMNGTTLLVSVILSSAPSPLTSSSEETPQVTKRPASPNDSGEETNKKKKRRGRGKKRKTAMMCDSEADKPNEIIEGLESTSTISTHVKMENTITPEEALYHSMSEFELALDKAYKDLERSLYG